MVTSFSTVLALSFVVLVAVPWLYRIFRPHRRFPGPPRLPLLGNAHQLPKTEMWLEFSRWQKQYGVSEKKILAFCYSFF